MLGEGEAAEQGEQGGADAGFPPGDTGCGTNAAEAARSAGARR